MRAGRLKERIELLEFKQEQSPTGQKTKGQYVPWATVWAEPVCENTAISEEGGAVAFVSRWKFYIRKRPGISGNMRVRWQDRTFELLGPPVTWKNEPGGLTLVAREVT